MEVKMNKKKVLLLVVVMMCVLFIGNTLAFLTDTETKENTFTIGSVNISLTEPNWNEANAQNLAPGAVVAKDPTITNAGTNDAYVFLKVEVPKANVVVDGSEVAKELFSYTLKDGWYQVSSTDGTDKVTHIYAYATDENTLTKLAKDASSTLFDSVKLEDFENLGAGVSSTLKINVTAYAIQTENIVEGTVTPSAVWNVVTNELGL